MVDLSFWVCCSGLWVIAFELLAWCLVLPFCGGFGVCLRRVWVFGVCVLI